MTLTQLSDDEILARIRSISAERSRLLAQLVALLVEVEERRLHTRSACPSMFAFCRDELGMSDGAAHRRCIAAQLVRRFPSLYGAIERNEVHLSALCLLREHLTPDNLDELLAACRGRSTRQVEELLARRAPRPERPATLHVVPTQATLPTTPTDAPPRERPRVAPLSEDRFELRVAISRELRDKLQRARDLMRHANPQDDLERVVDRAVDALLEKLEKQRVAKTDRPRKTARPASTNETDHIPAAVRRAVFERDGLQCTYVDARGKRCACTTWLELDHVVPRADGGVDDIDNLRVRCRAHNQLAAEERFGKEHVARCTALRHRSRDTEAAELALRGLVHMGFKARAARDAVETVASRHSGDTTPLPPAGILREALRVLT